jgi:hypothetical protein
VKSQPPKPLKLLGNTRAKVVDTKERKDKAEQPASLSPAKAEDTNEWLTGEQAVKLGLTPGSRLYRQAIGEALPKE